MVARWESGSQVPSVRTLMKIAKATGYELAVGLREPRKTTDRSLALEVIEQKGQKTKGDARSEAGDTSSASDRGARRGCVPHRTRGDQTDPPSSSRDVFLK